MTHSTKSEMVDARGWEQDDPCLPSCPRCQAQRDAVVAKFTDEVMMRLHGMVDGETLTAPAWLGLQHREIRGIIRAEMHAAIGGVAS